MSELSWQSRLSIPDTTLVQEANGEAILLSLESESYFGLDESGTRFWGALASGGTLDEVADKLLETFEVDEDELRKDLLAFVGELLEGKLVEIEGHDH
ncbi:MAG: PqqD family protein [Verrucomicrobiota bacterium]